MSASTPQEIVEVLDALEACADRLGDLDFDACGTGELLSIIEGTQRVVRKLRVPGHAVITQLGLVATGYELGGTLGQALADRLRITKAEADRRIAEAAVLGPRRALTGQPLQPVLAATAAAERRGLIGDAQVGVIRKFFAKLPDTVDAHGRAVAEAKLTLFATGFRPDELAEYARVYKDCLKPNGDFDPDKAPEPARNRGITLGKQQSDGLSKISGYISAECRATVEPVLAKLAAPGMCNPADDAPVIDGRATAEAVDRDNRTAAQRNHDALNAGCRLRHS